MLSYGFELRKKSETKQNQLTARCHTIFTINMLQNENDEKFPVLSFIDLSGSERIAKNINEGQKYQEAIILISNFINFGKCLQAACFL